MSPRSTQPSKADGETTPGLSGRLTLGIAEVARALGVGRSTVYELMASGELPSLKVAGRRLVRVADLETLIVAKADEVTR